MTGRRTLLVAGLSSALCGASVMLAAQVELDRIVSRVGERIVTQSDIRQARVLKLVDDTTSDESTLRALETRLLILHELNRAAPLPPAGSAEVDARRTEWAARVGGDAQLSGVLRSGGMSEGDLDRWLRDDLRIHAYLRRQFGMLGETERARAIGDWLARLRQRADLSP